MTASNPDASTVRPTPPGRVDENADDEVVSVVGLLNVLLRQRWTIVACALLAALATAAVTLRSPRNFASTATFVPQGRGGGGSGVSGLAAQLGISVAGGDPAQSPQFYVDLAESREILGGVVDTRYAYQGANGPVNATLVALYAAGEENPAYRRDVAIEQLKSHVRSRVSAATGVIQLTVTTGDAGLSRAIAARMIQLINEFNLERRQSHAAAERRFTEQRLAQVRDEMRTAENRLETFLQGNRGFASPSLELQETRLRRDVTLQQQLFVTLAQAFEQAKIDEVRDTPVITLVESPEVPARPEARGTVRKTVLALFGGLIIGVALAFLRDYARRWRDDGSPELAEFATLKRATVGDITHPWRPLARLFGGRREGRSATPLTAGKRES